MEGTCHDLAQALQLLEERLAADIHEETPASVECSAEGDEAELPPGLESYSEQTTVANDSGSTSNASTLSPPPGLNGTETSRETDMPRKITISQRPFDVLRAFQAGMGNVERTPPSTKEKTKETTDSARKLPTREAGPLKKFCAFCGMQVDPEYLTAKFCAFCGAEHVQIAPAGQIASAGAVPPMHHQSCWQSYDDYSDGVFVQGDVDFYDASLAWQGEAAAWDASENGEFSAYDYSYPFSASTASSWPPQGVAW